MSDLILDARQLVASIPEGIGVLRSLDATRLARARMLLGDLADGLEQARAQVAELEQQRTNLGLLAETMGKGLDQANLCIAELETDLHTINEIVCTTMPSHRGRGHLGVAALANRIGELTAELEQQAEKCDRAFVQERVGVWQQRHTWECANRTRIGVAELDACDCPEVSDR